MLRVPPKWMEGVVKLLLPRSYREHVLGDLRERYSNPGQYLMDALQTVPLVCWSHIRRMLTPASDRPQTAGGSGGMSMSPEDIRRKADQLRSKAVRGSLAQLVTAILVAGLGWHIAHSVNPYAVGGLIFAITLYLTVQVYIKRPGPKVPPGATLATAITFYRRELERQRDVLAHMWLWYVGPMLAALIAPVLAQFSQADQRVSWANIAPFVVLTLFWGVMMIRISRREVHMLQREIEDLKRQERS